MALESHSLGSDVIRRNWREVLDEVMKGESVKILRSGKPIGVIVPFELWDKAKDHLEDLDDRIDLRKKFEKYRRDLAAGLVERSPIYDRAIAEEIELGLMAPLATPETEEQASA